jgi:hypothetical protein
MKIEVLTPVTMEITVFWDVTMYSTGFTQDYTATIIRVGEQARQATCKTQAELYWIISSCS